jgi:hypothetical protein
MEGQVIVREQNITLLTSKKDIVMNDTKEMIDIDGIHLFQAISLIG